MRHALFAAVLFLAFASTAFAQTAPSVSYTTATIPASLLGPETKLDCLTAAEQSGSTVTASLVCYDWAGPSLHLKDVTGTVSQGVLVLPIWDCVDVGVTASLAMAVDLNTGNGMTMLAVPCTGPTSYGPLTMTELPENHDEDGDGCTDRNELYSDRDPFDPSDCGTGGTAVGGIVEMPALVAAVPPNDDEYAWLIVPMLMAAVVVVTIVGGLLLEYLPRRWNFPIPPAYAVHPFSIGKKSSFAVFVGGTVLATVLSVAVIMAVAMTKLGCCD